MRIQEITPASALSRCKYSPYVVIVASSGSGKSTIINCVMNPLLSSYMKSGIGDKSQTTIVPFECYLDTRIKYENIFALQLFMKDYSGKDIHMMVINVLTKLFHENDYDDEATLAALDENKFEEIIEPANALYHLGKLKEECLGIDEFKEVLKPILSYMVNEEFSERVRKHKAEFKGKKVNLSEIRENVFEQMFEEMPLSFKEKYYSWLENIGEAAKQRLENVVGKDLLNGDIKECRIGGEEHDEKILEFLFDPKEPFSLILDRIIIASRPRNKLIDAVSKESNQEETEKLFRLCIRDTMGITQSGIDAESTRNALESALNCKADSILFLMSLEERNDTLIECCKALAEKKKELKSKRNLNPQVYVLFTKADCIIENIVSNRKTGIFMNQAAYDEYVPAALETIEESMEKIRDMLNTYDNIITEEQIGWISLRYKEKSEILTALNNDARSINFTPEGLFRKIADITSRTLQQKLPKGMKNPLFVTVTEQPDLPAIEASLHIDRLTGEIKQLQNTLTQEPEVVNGYIISDKTPRIHGRSVHTYWKNLAVGMGHHTNATVYGNFSLNMKLLIRRKMNDVFPSFAALCQKGAVEFTADRLETEVLADVIKMLFHDEKTAESINPAIDERNVYMKRIYEYYQHFFNSERYAALIDRVAYDMSYGNETIKKRLTKIYNSSEYDTAIRKMQKEFRRFFGSDEFVKILEDEFNDIMTEMINKMFVII